MPVETLQKFWKHRKTHESYFYHIQCLCSWCDKPFWHFSAKKYINCVHDTHAPKIILFSESTHSWLDLHTIPHPKVFFLGLLCTLYTSRKSLRHLLATRVPSCEEQGLLMSRPAKSPGRSHLFYRHNLSYHDLLSTACNIFWF